MRRHVLFAFSSLGLAACTSLLGDFTVQPGASSSGDPGSDGSILDGALTDASTSTDSAVSDAPDDAPPGTLAPEPTAIATNSLATCATVAYAKGTAAEKLVTFCWGAGNDSPAFLGAAQGDPSVGGFMRPRLPNTNPPTFLAFESLSGNGRGLAFMGRIGSGQAQGSGTAYCWGSNSQAECGLPAAGMVPPTVLAPSNVSLRVSNGALAPYHGCMISQNRLYCWGQNNYCEVRSGATSSCNSADPKNPFVRFVEEQSGGVIGGGQGGQAAYQFDQFAGGYDHSCVVFRKAGGLNAAVECWGKNDVGQTGQPGPLLGAFTDNPSTIPGTSVPTGFSDLELASGASHACAIVSKTTLVCWGKNDLGQAAPGKTSPAAPATVVLPNGMAGTLTSLALGGDVSCFVTTGGAGAPRAICFGDKAGPLGRAATDVNKEFAFVDGLKDVAQIAVGGDHACAIARAQAQLPTAPRSLFCWGKNDQKQIDPSSPLPSFPTAHRVEFPVVAP